HINTRIFRFSHINLIHKETNAKNPPFNAASKPTNEACKGLPSTNAQTTPTGSAVSADISHIISSAAHDLHNRKPSSLKASDFFL
ncbi:MAG: hypothetical protein IJN84_03640, partial [Clostridia bacterium]|nr:hypothetical protein [Clostridia bacterium]